MTKWLINVLMCIAGVCSSASVQAVPEYDLNYTIDATKVTEYRYLGQRADNKLGINNVALLPVTDWQVVNANSNDFLMDAGNAWFSFDLLNNSKTERLLYLTLANRASITAMKLYLSTPGKAVVELPLTLYRNNHRVSLLTIAAFAKSRVFINIDTTSAVNLPVSLYQQSNFLVTSANSNVFNGIAIGGMLSLTLVQLLLFLGGGSKHLLLLSGYFLSRTLLLSMLLGWNLQYLLPDISELSGVELPLLTVMSSILLLYFSIELFDINNLHPHMARYIRYGSGLLFSYIPMSLLMTATQNMSVSIGIFLMISILLTVQASLLFKRGVQLAKPFMITTLFECLLAVVVIVGLLWYQSGIFKHRELLLSSFFWFNGFLLTLIISRQYYYSSRDKEIAQQQALKNALSSKVAQAELLALQKNNQETLEHHVQERTLELNIALQELEQANQELERKNTLDELSGLHNRRYYDQKILAEFRRSKRNLTPLSVVLIDIDHFKQVNDNYGHQAGDYVITQVAAYIKQALKRSTDIGCRYGGEEFCLILPDTDLAGALELAETLRVGVDQLTLAYQQQLIPITISCGVTTYLHQAYALSEHLFAAADKALYMAKQNGRNQVQKFAIDDLDFTQELSNA